MARCENEGGSKSRVNQRVVGSDGSRGGGGSHAAASPSFLVHNMHNVNAELWRAWSLLPLWDFEVYKGRISRTHVILRNRGEPSLVKIMPTSCRSRYFDDGRLYIASRARQYRHYTGYIHARVTWATRGGSGEV